MISALCLATVVYLEARGEPYKGQLAVAEVVMNRVKDDDYPDSICAVAKQKRQFKFKKGLDKVVQDSVSMDAAVEVMKYKPNLTKGATHFHSGKRPSWAKRFKETAKIGKHRFYKGKKQ